MHRDNWGLFDLINQLAEETEMIYPVAANWVLRQALGDRYSVARLMQFQGIIWDADIQFTCRNIGLQLLRYYSPDTIYARSLREIDELVYGLLFPE